MLCNTMGSGRYQLSRQKRYGDAWFNVTRGGDVSDLQGKSIVNVTWAPKGAIKS